VISIPYEKCNECRYPLASRARGYRSHVTRS
jgi:hypothetical protein